jgi:hypothetical protein
MTMFLLTKCIIFDVYLTLASWSGAGEKYTLVAEKLNLEHMSYDRVRRNKRLRFGQLGATVSPILSVLLVEEKLLLKKITILQLGERRWTT